MKVRHKPVAIWTSAEDLHGKCAIALGKAIAAKPRPGWVRAPEGTGQEVAAELSRLSSENSGLRQEVERLRATVSASADPPKVQLSAHWSLDRFAFLSPVDTKVVDTSGSRSSTVRGWEDARPEDNSPSVAFRLSLDLESLAPKFLTEIFVNLRLFDCPFDLTSTFDRVRSRSPIRHRPEFTINALRGMIPSMEDGISLAPTEGSRLAPGATVSVIRTRFQFRPPLSSRIGMMLKFGHDGAIEPHKYVGASPAEVEAGYLRLIEVRRNLASEEHFPSSEAKTFVRLALGIPDLG